MIRWSVACCCWILFALAGYGQEASWSSKQFTSLDGLPQNSVVSMVMDGKGYLLLSTESGLVRFDGCKFRRIPLAPESNGTGGRTREIIVLPDGLRILRDAGRHLYTIGPGSAESLTRQSRLAYPFPILRGTFPTFETLRKANDSESPYEASDEWHVDVLGVVTVGTSGWATMGRGRVLVYEGERLERSIPVGEHAARLVKLGASYFVFDEELNAAGLLLEDGSVRPIVSVGRPMAQERNAGDRVHWREDQGFACYWSGHRIWTMTPTAGGDTMLWRELPVLVPEKCRINDIYFDTERKVLFVGTDTWGLFVFRPQEMRTVHMQEGSDACYAQVNVNDHRILVHTNEGAMFLDTRNGEQLHMAASTSLRSTAIMREPGGSLLFSVGRELMRMDSATNTMTVVVRDRSGGFDTRSYLLDEDTLWMGSVQGVGMLVNDRYTLVHPFTTKNWTETPTAMCRDAHGDLLLASCRGLSRVRGLRHAPITEFPGKCPRVLHRDGDHVFIGTYGTGAYVLFPDGSFRQLPMDRQGYLTHVHAFAEDANGSWWLTSNQGLFRVERADIMAWLKDPLHHIYYARYGVENGIANSEFNGGCDPPYLRFADGGLSFPSMNGLVWLPAEGVPDPFPTAPIAIEEVRVDGALLPSCSSVQLPGRHSELVVQLSMPYWGSQGNAQLEYLLDDGWYPMATEQREIRLQRLPPGEHVLVIRKVGGLVRDDRGAAQLGITVPYPFYRSWWFLSLLACLLGAFFLWAMRVGGALMRRRNLLLEHRVQERTQALRHANEELQQAVEVRQSLVSVISHDIVSPLRFIARVSGSALRDEDPAGLRNKLADIANSSDRLYTHAQNLLNWIRHQQGSIEVRPRHIALRSVVDEQFDLVRAHAQSNGVELMNEVPYDDVVRTDRDILVVILQNLIGNSVKHTQTGRITVGGMDQGKAYCLTISDTGPGFPEEVLERIREANKTGKYPYQVSDRGHGLGFVIIFSLLPLVQARLEVETLPGQGTTIQVLLQPLAGNSAAERTDG